MTKDRNILLVLACILAFFAAWRIFSYRAAHGERNPEIVENIQQAVAARAPELFVETPISLSKQTEDPALTVYGHSSVILPSGEARTNAHTPSSVAPSSLPTQSVSVSTETQKQASFPTAGRSSTTTNAVSTSQAKGGNSSQSATFISSAQKSYSPSPSDQLAQERATHLSPYLLPNKEAQKKLDADFKDLSNAISRAIQTSLTPKSKKNANIEKYLHKDGATSTVSAQTDPFQTMLTQVANQKKGIVQNVTEAFGTQAGQRAGQLMDNFQKDLTAEVTKTDQTPQVTAQNIQKIAQTYQQKFDRMNQQNQYEQYVKDLTAQYNAQTESLKKLYPQQEELNNEFARISNKALQAELSLPSKNLTPEEYAKARYEIQYNMHQEMEEAVKKAGSSMTGLHQYDNEHAQDILNDLEKKEEEGLIVSVPRKESANNIQALSETLLKEQHDTLAQIEQAYGVQARADFKPLLDEYYQEMMKTTQEEMTPSQRYRAKEHLRAQYSRRILEMQRDKILQMENVPQEQKEVALQNIEKAINALPKM